jgi:hypothetical protein
MIQGAYKMMVYRQIKPTYLLMILWLIKTPISNSLSN